MRQLIPIIILLLLAACTQAPQGPTQPPAQTPGTPAPESAPKPEGKGFDVSAQLSEIGLVVVGQSSSVKVKVNYDFSGCPLELEYTPKSCSTQLQVSGNSATWCDSNYEYKLTGNCDLQTRTNQLVANPKTDAKVITSGVFVPWYEFATDLYIQMSLAKSSGTLTYYYVTGKYMDILPTNFKILPLAKRAICTDNCQKIYVFIDNPSQFFLAEGTNAQALAMEVITANTQKVYDGRPTDVLNYIPSEWYGHAQAALLCYHPLGFVKVDPAQFSWADNQLNAKFDPQRKIVAPAGFILGVLGTSTAGKQLTTIGAPFNKMEPYQAHYRACQIACSETCLKDDSLVMTKGDCTSVSSVTTNPTITQKMDTIYDIFGKTKTFTSLQDSICIGLLNAEAEELVMPNYKTGDGLAYAKPVIIDHSVNIIVTTSTTDPKTLIEHIINNKFNSNFKLEQQKTAGNCVFYKYGSPTDWQGYAAHCTEADGLTLLFINACTQTENCLPSAQALFDQLTS